MPEIEYIIFDYAEVIANGIIGVDPAIAKAVGRPEKEVNRMLRGVALRALFIKEIPEDIYWQSILNDNKLDVEVSTLKEIVRQNFTEVEGTKGIIQSLKKQGYKLGLLSDHAEEWIAYCKENIYNHEELFDTLGYSYTLKQTKLYECGEMLSRIVHAMDADSKKTLFIDDFEGNIKTASNYGINTIHFKNAGQLRTDLEERFGIIV